MNPPDRRTERAHRASDGGQGRRHARAAWLFTAVAACLASLQAHAAAGLSLGFRDRAPKVVLKGPDAAQQLILSHPDGSDATHVARWSVEPAGFATIEPGGRLRPLA
jgi:hypothetical protein